VPQWSGCTMPISVPLSAQLPYQSDLQDGCHANLLSPIAMSMSLSQQWRDIVVRLALRVVVRILTGSGAAQSKHRRH
jgi:hypothetical protein